MSGEQTYPPLDQETRAAVDTFCAAFHLLRAPQTLRLWACKGNGPIKPVRNSRGGPLYWRVTDIRRVLGVGS